MKAILLIALLATTCYSAQWAVLVAGSNGFYNYRHQSDICHAYQILLEHGLPAENIIVLSYDDVANSPQNPYPGTLFNKPSGTKAGVNVNQGCVIDYKGAAVTPSNYLAIITGNADGVKGGNGRVLKSTAADTVFLNFADHGAVGLIAFPSQYLYADQLQTAFLTMSQNSMYSQLTYYLESCESGSMFQTLPKNLSIYAVSAASPSQSSWAQYCPPDDVIKGKHIGSCLGDEFSVNWMENTDASDTASLTLQQQYVAVKAATKQSQVMQWGDITFTSEVIGTFLGLKNSGSNDFLRKVQNHFKSQEEVSTASISLQDTHDVKLGYLLSLFNANPNDDTIYMELQEELATTKKFATVIGQFSQKYKISGIYYGSTNFQCYRTLIDELAVKCGQLNEQSMKFLKYLYQYCGMYTFWEQATFDC